MSQRRNAWLTLVLTLGGCSSTGVGNPSPATLQLSIIRDDDAEAGTGGAADGAAEAGAPSEAGAGGAPESSNGSGLPRAAVKDALLVIGRLILLPCEPSEPPSVAVGPFLVDLVQGGTSPAIPPLRVPAGGFCGLDAPLAPAEAPSRLVGRSLYFDGTRADGTPFRFYADVQATLRVRAPAGVSWGPGTRPVRSLFWALRPRQWLEPGELSGLEATNAGDGTLSIDLARHPLLLRAIRSRLAGRSTLYDDANGDTVFDLEDRLAALGYGIPDAD